MCCYVYQKEAEDNQGAVLVTALDCRPQRCHVATGVVSGTSERLEWLQCDADDNQGGFGGYRSRLRTIKSAVSSITEG